MWKYSLEILFHLSPNYRDITNSCFAAAIFLFPVQGEWATSQHIGANAFGQPVLENVILPVEIAFLSLPCIERYYVGFAAATLFLKSSYFRFRFRTTLQNIIEHQSTAHPRKCRYSCWNFSSNSFVVALVGDIHTSCNGSFRPISDANVILKIAVSYLQRPNVYLKSNLISRKSMKSQAKSENMKPKSLKIAKSQSLLRLQWVESTHDGI